MKKIAAWMAFAAAATYLLYSANRRPERFDRDALLEASRQGDSVRVRRILKEQVRGMGGRAYRDRLRENKLPNTGRE
jgi:hypothetical protein